MKVERMSPCPRCQSTFTGEIMPADGFSDKDMFLRRNKMLKKGRMYKYVNPQDYREYYARNEINAFCFDCGYEFRGEIEVEQVDGDKWTDFINKNHLLRPETIPCHPFKKCGDLSKIVLKERNLKMNALISIVTEDSSFYKQVVQMIPLDIQKEGIEILRPGDSLNNAQIIVTDMITDEILDQGIPVFLFAEKMPEDIVESVSLRFYKKQTSM